MINAIQWFFVRFGIAFGLAVIDYFFLPGPGFWKTFVAVMLVSYLPAMVRVLAPGATMVWGLIQRFDNVVMGISLFLLLLLLYGQMTGFNPAVAYNTIKGSGGLKGVLVGERVQQGAILTILFAVVVGGFVIRVINGQHRGLLTGLLVTAFAVNTVAYVASESVTTVPSTKEMDHAYATGVYPAKVKSAVLDTLKGVEKPAPKTEPATKPVVSTTPTTTNKPVASNARPQGNTNTPSAASSAPAGDPDFPTYGKNVVGRVGVGIPMYLDPMNSSISCSDSTRFVLESNPAVYLDAMGPGGTIDQGALAKWRAEFKKDKYIAYPIGVDEITCGWSIR